MKIIDISLKYIKNNKKNSFIIISSMTISIILFIFMNILSNDVENIILNQTKDEYTIKHAQYINPTNKQIRYFENNNNIDILGKIKLLGISNIGNGQSLQLIYQDENATKINFLGDILYGKKAIKENEIIVNEWFLKQKNIKNPIGKEITLKYNNDYNNSHEYEKKFIISGVIESNDILKAQGTSVVLVSKSFANQISKIDQIVFTLKNEKNISNQIKKIISDGNLNKNSMILNNELLKAKSDSLYMKIPYILIDIVLLATTLLLIYNIFNILIIKRRKDFGIMKSLGLNSKIIIKILIKEMSIYLSISIILGIIFSIIISRISKDYIISSIYGSYYLKYLPKNINYIHTYIFSIIVVIITFLISIYKPIKDIYQTDPIICIKNLDEFNEVKTFSSKYYKLVSFFKNSYSILALKNMYRNKKRTIVSILSLAITFFVMSSVYSKGSSNFLSDGVMKYWIQGDYLLHNISLETVHLNNISYNDNFFNKLNKIDGLEKIKKYRNKWFDLKIPENRIDKNTKYWLDNKEMLEARSEISENSKIYNNTFECLGIDDSTILKDIIIDGKDNLSKIEGEDYVYITQKTSDTFNIKTGEKISFAFNIIDEKTGTFVKQLNKNFKVAGIISELPITSQVGGEFGGVISINQFNKFVGNKSYERFDLWSSKLANNKKIENELNEIMVDNKGILIPYNDEVKEYEQSENRKLMIMSTVAFIVILLATFNSCNSISMNIKDREKEISIMRSIGLSKKSIKNIYYKESYFYVMSGFAISIFPSFLIRYFIIKEFDNINLFNINFILFTFFSFVILCSFIIFITNCSINKIMKKDYIKNINDL